MVPFTHIHKPDYYEHSYSDNLAYYCHDPGYCSYFPVHLDYCMAYSDNSFLVLDQHNPLDSDYHADNYSFPDYYNLPGYYYIVYAYYIHHFDCYFHSFFCYCYNHLVDNSVVDLTGNHFELVKSSDHLGLTVVLKS